MGALCCPNEEVVVPFDEFISSLHEIVRTAGEFEFRACLVCGQRWLTDTNGKSPRLAFSSPPNEENKVQEIERLRAHYIAKYSDDLKKQCVWVDCENPVMRGMEICHEHQVGVTL